MKNNEIKDACKYKIKSESDVVLFDWNYAEAEACGWIWSTDESTIYFKNELQASDNINKVWDLKRFVSKYFQIHYVLDTPFVHTLYKHCQYIFF